MNEQKEVVIKAKTGWFSINFKEIWEYRDLIGVFIKRNFKLIYKQTILGPIWLMLNPIITSVIFTFVFGQFAGISTDGIPQFLFYMAGTTLWSLFSTSVLNNANIFVDNASVYGKIYFPRLASPIAQTINAFINFLIQFAALLVFFVYYLIVGNPLNFTANMLLIPVLLIHLLILSFSIGLIASSLTAKYRDFAFIISLGLQLWMYVTPVVYPMSLTGGWMYKLLLLNPMTPIMNNFKWAFLGSGEIMIGSWILSAMVTAILLLMGLVAFGKVEKNFVDTV